MGTPYEDEDVIGANTLTSAGSAYILKNIAGTWTQIKKIVPSQRAANDNFGISVSISGTFVIVGAYGEDQDADEQNTLTDAGSVYIFEKDQGGTDNWGQTQKIVASDRASEDKFGLSVSLSGDYAVVGTIQEDEDANGGNTLDYAGSAYIFKKDQGGLNNWGQIQKIAASDREIYDYFGCSVSISGNYVIVGAYSEDDDLNGANSFTSAGSVYIFEKDQGGTDNWGQTQKITASDRAASDQFGNRVSISGDYAVVGAPSEDEDENGLNTLPKAGSAYILKNIAGTWTQIKK